MKPILNINDLKLEPFQHGEKFASRDAPISSLIGAKKLGYNLTVVPAGKMSCPFHNHHNNEEMFYVIEGAGEVRIGDQRYPIKAGDVICTPAGGRETAHHIMNTSSQELKYLSVSTMLEPEVCEYPDSNKFLVMAGRAPGEPKNNAKFNFVGRANTEVDYWDGEV
jgi:uncharacterized cupin superfamily protein